MAYMSQERKAELAPAIKAVLKKFGMKGTIAVRHHSTLVVNLKEGKLDIVANANAVRKEQAEMMGHEVNLADGYIDVNTYHIDRGYTGEVRQFLTELKDAMMQGNFDKSDIMTDYFHVGWYIDINVGRWNKPYTVK